MVLPPPLTANSPVTSPRAKQQFRSEQTYTDVKFENHFVNVSTSDKYNDASKGMALYLVETDKDGVV